MTKLKREWIFDARVDDESKYTNGVYDGDTIYVVFDTGFGGRQQCRIRILGINTPELRGESRPEGIEAREFTRDWIAEACKHGMKWPLIIKTKQTDSFGRYLGAVERKCDGRNLTVDLLEAGYPPYK